MRLDAIQVEYLVELREATAVAGNGLVARTAATMAKCGREEEETRIVLCQLPWMNDVKTDLAVGERLARSHVRK